MENFDFSNELVNELVEHIWSETEKAEHSDNTSHNKSMDAICSQCGDDGRIGGSEDPNSGVPCPECVDWMAAREPALKIIKERTK